jgi:ribosomal protein S14
MNYAKGHVLARTRVEFSFRALVDRTIREQNREERRLAEQRATKHQFRARNSCILDGRNYRFARRLLLFPRAQFGWKHAGVSRVLPQRARSYGIGAEEFGRNLLRWQ